MEFISFFHAQNVEQSVHVIVEFPKLRTKENSVSVKGWINLVYSAFDKNPLHLLHLLERSINQWCNILIESVAWNCVKNELIGSQWSFRINEVKPGLDHLFRNYH